MCPSLIEDEAHTNTIIWPEDTGLQNMEQTIGTDAHLARFQ